MNKLRSQKERNWQAPSRRTQQLKNKQIKLWIRGLGTRVDRKWMRNFLKMKERKLLGCIGEIFCFLPKKLP